MGIAVARVNRHKAMNARTLAGCALSLLLTACASNPPAPVEDIALDDRGARREVPSPRPVRPAAAALHKVVAGDTLYSIAFKNGLDYREIARWNRIESPYRIYVGQELRLADDIPAGGAAVAAVPAAPGAATVTPLSEAPRRPAAADTRGRPGVFTPVPPASAGASGAAVPGAAGAASASAAGTSAAATSPGAPASAAPGSAASTVKPAATSVAAATVPPPSIAPVPTPPPAAAAAKVPPADPVAVPAKGGALAPGANTTAVAAPGPTTPVLNSGGVSWRWPASGKVVGTFVAGDQTRQGVDIAGSDGASVVAAADGSVVYSGNGLLGYGELIIVKHSASFLSAYGHNRKRLVKEGDTVKAGQSIAEMGGSNRQMLHFEIRRNGKPVNPLEYLPAK